MIETDLLRGATAWLYPKGRVVLWLGHIGGGTQWYGSWSEDGDRIRLSLPRVQVSEGGAWEAGETVDPPERVVLARESQDAWVETERTIAKFVDIHLTWHERPSGRTTEREAQKHHAFQPEGPEEEIETGGHETDGDK
jgi:hypothetical protein